MEMKMYTMSAPDLQAIANDACGEMIEKLAQEGLLKGDPAEIKNRYAVVLAEPSWFGRVLSKIWGESKNLQICIMKLL